MSLQHDSSNILIKIFTFSQPKMATCSTILWKVFWLHLFFKKGGNGIPHKPQLVHLFSQSLAMPFLMKMPPSKKIKGGKYDGKRQICKKRRRADSSEENEYHGKNRAFNYVFPAPQYVTQILLFFIIHSLCHSQILSPSLGILYLQHIRQ